MLLGFRPGEQVAIKVRAADDARGMREAVALERAAGEHVVRLLDLHVDDDRCCLVLERLEPLGLDALLDRRAAFDAGEVVTIVAPIALALDRMHRAGVAHARISTRSVRFRDDGAPVLVGFADADSFPAGSPEIVLERQTGVMADRAALAAITSQLLARCGGARARAAAGLADELAREAPLPGILAERLFALAASRPVRFEADEEPTTARAIEPAEPVPETQATVRHGLLELVPAELRDRVQPLVDAVAGRWSRLGPRARRLGLGAVAGVLALTALGALLPPTEPQDAAVTPVPIDAPVEAATGPEDPIAAAGQLLERRADCLAEGSVLCLDTVTQSGSAASAADRLLLEAIAVGRTLPLGIAPGEPVLVERLGDSALVQLPEGSEPSSVLLFRTAHGWRVRDYLE